MFGCSFSRRRHLLFKRSSYLCIGICIHTYISADCRNRITTSHAPARTTAFRILIICNGKWPAVNPSAPRFQRPALTSPQVKLVGCILETSVAADFMGGLMHYLVQHKLPGSKPTRIVPRSARLISKDRDPRPDAALNLKPLDQERKKRKFSPSLLQRQATLADSWRGM